MQSRMNNVTIPAAKSKGMKEHGRFGDTEMAHVTAGEIVVPLSVQTPAVINTLKQEFDKADVPMETYVVQSTQAEENPATGHEEFGLGKFIKKAVGIAAPIAGAALGSAFGPVGTSIGAQLGGALGSELSGGGESGGYDAQAQSEQAQRLIGGQPQQQGQAQDPITQRPVFTTSKITIDKETGKPVPQPMQGIDTDFPRVTSTPPFFPVPSEYESAALQLMQELNPTTGFQQFFDRSKLPAMRKNPYTGRPEFFDASWYLKNNPDVASHSYYGTSPAKAYEHYQQYGQKEGRVADQPRPMAPALQSNVSNVTTPVKASSLAQGVNSVSPLAGKPSATTNQSNYAAGNTMIDGNTGKPYTVTQDMVNARASLAEGAGSSLLQDNRQQSVENAVRGLASIAAPMAAAMSKGNGTGGMFGASFGSASQPNSNSKVMNNLYTPQKFNGANNRNYATPAASASPLEKKVYSDPTAEAKAGQSAQPQAATPNNAYNQRFIAARDAGLISDEDAMNIFKKVGFNDPQGAGGGRVNTFFDGNQSAGYQASQELDNLINSRKPTSQSQNEVPSWGQDLQRSAQSATNRLNSLTSASAYNPSNSGSVTRTSSLSPELSPRFRSRRYDGASIARNF